jgi:glycosyltransferase involved in cell wall biosynthesis
MMEEQPLISVIIPSYNYEAFLPDCVESLIAQSYSNWECIIVDDNSKDNTKEVAEALVKKDSRVHYYYRPQNAGPALARNFGLEKAKGAFIQFLDADDLVESGKFEKQLQVFHNDPSCDIVYSGVKYFRSGKPEQLFDDITLEGSKPWMKKLSGQGRELIKALLNGNIMVISSPLVKRSLFEKHGTMDPALYYNEDWELWARFAMKNAKFRYDESVGTQALIRVHDSYSKDNFKMYVYGLLACLKMLNELQERAYRKIMVPKITYHTRILDEKLMSTLRKNKKEALELTELIYKLTNIRRYSFYRKLFGFLPVGFCFAISRIIFLFQKLKNTVIYA